MTAVVSILDALSLSVLRIHATALEGRRMPPFRGDYLHKALYAALADAWCSAPNWAPGAVLACDECAQAGVCPFDRLMNGRRDVAWSRKVGVLMAGNRESALCLRDDGRRWAYVSRGHVFSFEVTLIGAECAAHAVEVVQALVTCLPERGIGPQVEEVLGGSRQQSRLRARVEGAEVLGYDLRSGSWRWDDLALATGIQQGTVNHIISLADARHWQRMLEAPVQRLSLRLLSPTCLPLRERHAAEPTMSALLRTLTRRLRILSEAWGAGEWPQAEYGPLLDLAEATRLDYSEAVTGTDSHGKSAWVGQIWYSHSGLATLLPILSLGQWLNLGRGAVYGNGQYMITELG